MDKVINFSTYLAVKSSKNSDRAEAYLSLILSEEMKLGSPASSAVIKHYIC